MPVPWMCGASMGMVFCPASDSYASNSGTGFSLLFKSWVVADDRSYALACLGVFARGALRQLLAGARAALAGAPPRGLLAPPGLLAAEAALFAAGLALAYVNMLVAMAYDFGLIGALVAGETAVFVARRLAARRGAGAGASGGAGGGAGGNYKALAAAAAASGPSGEEAPCCE